MTQSSMVAYGEQGSAVKDVQERLVLAGYLDAACVDGTFGTQTLDALKRFCAKQHIDFDKNVTRKVWAALVDASFMLGDRTLYLRMPYFHGHDVAQLQHALGVLGFSCAHNDGIFGATTERALRLFQTNMGLPADGIAGAYTYAALERLHFSWEDKDVVPVRNHVGFARAASVLERVPVCVFGTHDFTRDVARRMGNLALATTPTSKVVSADNLLVAPTGDMLRVHVVLPSEPKHGVGRVTYSEDALSARLHAAIKGLPSDERMIEIELAGCTWASAGPDRSAQHFAITLLDGLCAALYDSDKDTI